MLHVRSFVIGRRAQVELGVVVDNRFSGLHFGGRHAAVIGNPVLTRHGVDPAAVVPVDNLPVVLYIDFIEQGSPGVEVLPDCPGDCE